MRTKFAFDVGCRKWQRRVLGRNFLFAPLLFGVIRGGHVCIMLHSCKRMQVFLLCIYGNGLAHVSFSTLIFEVEY